jgi:hypothetical protein
LGFSLAALPLNYRYPKQDFVAAAQYIEAHRGPDEAVATSGAAVIPFREYLQRNWTTVTTAQDLTHLRHDRAVWLVYTFPRYLERSAPEIMSIARSSCPAPEVFHGTVGGGDIFACRLEALP